MPRTNYGVYSPVGFSMHMQTVALGSTYLNFRSFRGTPVSNCELALDECVCQLLYGGLQEEGRHTRALVECAKGGSGSLSL